MMHCHKKGWMTVENQCFGVSFVMLTIALCVAGGVSARADHPTSQAIAKQRSANDLIEETRTPTGKTDWEFCCLDRTKVKPFEDPETKAVVLIFISPDCPIANAYHPQLKQMDERFRPQGIRFFLVHSSVDISTRVARNHAEAFDLHTLCFAECELLRMSFTVALAPSLAAGFTSGFTSALAPLLLLLLELASPDIA